jgi:hypothetical protein
MSLMFAIWFLGFRATNPVGETSYIRKVNEEDIGNYTSAPGVNVVLFGLRPGACEFADFSVANFTKNMTFLFAPESVAASYGCDSYPCTTAFVNGVRLRNGPTSATSFALWCQQLLEPSTIYVHNAEELESVLEKPGVATFGIDMDVRPKSLKPGDLFYSIPMTLFAELGMKVGESGLYVYRHADRQLVRVKGTNIESYFATDLVDIQPPFRYNRDFVAGMIFGVRTRADPVEIEIMTKLAKKLKNFAIGIMPYGLVFAGGYKFEEQSQFVAFRASDLGEHWRVPVNDTLRYGKVLEFLENLPTKTPEPQKQ